MLFEVKQILIPTTWQVCCTVFNWSVFLSWPKTEFHHTFNCSGASVDSLFIPSFSSLRHSFPYSHPSLLLWNFPRPLILLVLAFIACLCALTGTMGLPSPSLFCNYAFVFTLLLFPLPIYSHHRLYAPHTVETLPSLVNPLFSLNVSSWSEPWSPLFSQSLPSFCFYRMNQVRAWTLGPSVTYGKSFQKKWKENVLLYSPLTGKSLMHVTFFTLSDFSQVNYIWWNIQKLL